MRYREINLNLKGFSLLELMLALALSVIVLTLIIQFYLTMQNLTHGANTIARQQEDMRVLAYILNDSIGDAGYAGCLRLKNLQLSNHTNFNFSEPNAIHGFDSHNLPEYLRGKVKVNTEVIVVQHAGTDATILLAPVKQGASDILVKDNPVTRDNKFLLISDCINGDLFMAQNDIGKHIFMAEGKLAHDYVAQALITEISRFTELAYFVGLNNYGGSSLYVLLNQGKERQELITDITSFKVLYGIDENNKGTISAYYAAAQMRASQWEQVKAVKITLKYLNREQEIYIKLRNR